MLKSAYVIQICFDFYSIFSMSDTIRSRVHAMNMKFPRSLAPKAADMP